MARAPAEGNSLQWLATSMTRFSPATICIERVREIASLPVHVDVLLVEARAAFGECLRKYVAEKCEELGEACRGDPASGCLRMHPSAPQRLVRVDVAHPAHERLIEQELLNPGAATASQGDELGIIKVRIERITGNACSLLGQQRRNFRVAPEATRRAVGRGCEAIEGERAKKTLIREVKAQLAMRGVLDPKPNAHVSIVKCRRVPEQELTAHAEVSEERPWLCGRPLGGNRHPHELPAPRRRSQREAGDPALKVGSARCRSLSGQGDAVPAEAIVAAERYVALERARIPHLRSNHACSGNGGGQPRTHHLNFGKLRHVG